MDSNASFPLRVIHFIPGFRIGGIESLIMSIYRNLDKSKLNFDLIVDTLEELPEFDEIRSSGGRVFQTGRYLDNPFKYQLKIEKLFTAYSSEYSAIHLHDLIRALPILVSSKRHGISTRILHAHTDSLKLSKRSFFIPYIIKWSNRFATHYLACSVTAGEFFFKKKPYMVFKNAIEIERFRYRSDLREKVRSRLNFDTNNLVIGHTGRFTYAKNHKFLIEVFAKVLDIDPNARLLLIGDGDLFSEIKCLVTKLNLNHAVKLVGSQSNISDYLSAMDVFFLPSFHEGFCISLLEAQANGLPCLASQGVPNEVLLTPSVHTFNLANNPYDVAMRLLSLLQYGRYDAKNNIQIIRKNGYDITSQVSNILNMYINK